jgi:hypothetical protein
VITSGNSLVITPILSAITLIALGNSLDPLIILGISLVATPTRLL